MFEICVGVFWPSMSTMRDRYVPEASQCIGLCFTSLCPFVMFLWSRSYLFGLILCWVFLSDRFIIILGATSEKKCLVEDCPGIKISGGHAVCHTLLMIDFCLLGLRDEIEAPRKRQRLQITAETGFRECQLNCQN